MTVLADATTFRTKGRIAMTRRKRISAGGLAVLAALQLTALTATVTPSSADVTPNPIVTENAKPGTDNWRIDLEPSDDWNKQIKGYASAPSVNIGDPLDLYVTVNPVQTFKIEIYRTGYYGGLGGRLLRRVTDVAGVKQPDCPLDPATGLTACAWTSSYHFTVPDTWVSGIYLAKLTNAAGFQNYIVFVVRDDARPSDILLQQSVTTYQAYNNYPNDVPPGSPSGSKPQTGKSLYEYNSSDVVLGTGQTRAAKVSFDRPYSNDDGAGDFLDWELYYVRWVEEQGYDVSYTTDVDTHAAGARLLSHKAFLSVGHDEYWSKEMFDAAVAARDGGVNLGFFSGNSVYWQVRFEPSGAGAANRVMVCYKSVALDPVNGPTTTVKFRDPPVNRPEQTLMGAMSTGVQPNGALPAAHVVRNAGNWVYANTGVMENETIPGVVGYETDRYVNTYPAPVSVPGTYQLLSTSPYAASPSGTDYANVSIYQAGSGAWVFDASSIEWSWGLYNYNTQYADPRIQRMTANVLDRFVTAGGPPPPAAPTGLTATPLSDTQVALAWTDNASDETGYVLDRSDTPTFDTVTSEVLPANSTSLTDTVEQSDVYYYRLRAARDTDNSPYTPTAAASTAAYRDLVRTSPALVGQWRLGEQSGTVVKDGSSHGYDGQYQNGPTLGAPGAIAQDADGAVQLNGSTQKASLPALPSMGDFSIEGWSYLTNAGAANSALYGTNGKARILVRPGGGASSAYASVWLAGTEYALQPSGTQSNINTWVHWVLTRSDTTLRLYRDGVLLAQRADLPSGEPADVSGWIGAQGGNAYYFGGRVDEVAVYSSALSTSDVVDHYVSALNGLTPQPLPQPPAAPSGLAASVASSSTVSLSWADNATNEGQYVLQRSGSPTFANVTTVSLPAGSTSYDDTVPAADVYYYRVRAENSAGASDWSGPVGAATISYDQLLRNRSSVVARWRLDEAAGLAALDSAGSYDGQYQNGVNLGATGAIAKDPDTAVSLNGTNNKISLPTLPTFGDFSIEGWSNLTGTAANSALWGTGSTARILVRQGGGSTSTAYASVFLGGVEYALQPAGPSNVGQWVDWVLSRSGSTLSLYRNGVLLASRNDLPAAAPADVSGWIGAQGGNAYYFAGRIDEVTVYSNGLSADQVSNGYVAATNGVTPPPPPPPSVPYATLLLNDSRLMSYWRLGESAGTTAVDAKGAANGTYVNGVTLGAAGAVVNDPDTAASFNGTNNKVSLPALPTVTDFSVESWSNITTTQANNAVYGTNGNVRVLARPGGSAGTTAYVGVWLNGTEYTLQPNGPSNVGSWVQLVLVRQGASLTLYRNGVQVAQRTDLPAGATANISGWIGAQGGNAYYLTGRVDDVSVFNGALTAAQVARHYQAALAAPAP
jgi:hypothetical protein